MAPLKLSLLDFGYYYPPDVHAHDVINHLTESVQWIEELGYHRLWLSEHYGNEVAWGSPDTLLALLAGYTSRLKLGAAGVLLGFASPIRVAYTYKLLSALYPGRIDLGIARSKVPPEYQQALVRETAVPWEELLAELYGFLFNRFPDGHPFAEIRVPPQGAPAPDIWYLAASDSVLPTALENGGNLCLSLFHTNAPAEQLKDILRRYREMFYRKYDRLPECALAVQCNCSMDKATLERFSKELLERGWIKSARAISGTPDDCAERIRSLAETFAAEEVVTLHAYRTIAEKTASVALLRESLGAVTDPATP